jgi:glutathione S-transferase
VETAAVFSPSSFRHSQARFFSEKKFDFTENPEVPFLERIGLRRRQYKENQQKQAANMSHNLYTDETPADVKNAKGLHLLTMSTPNGQAVQIYLEELKDVYGIEWTTTLINIMTNEQKKDWFLRLDPNGSYNQPFIIHRRTHTDHHSGRIPVLIDNTENPPFPVMETSAELFYLLKKYDKDDKFGFQNDLERSECLQWTFFWHGSGAPYAIS